MECPACGRVNSRGRIYCGGCAQAIGVSCAVCSFVNEPSDRYCGGCARDLPAAPAPAVEPVRVAVAGPSAPAAAAPITPPVSPVAEGDQGRVMNDLLELDDLVPPPSAAPCAASCPTIDTDVTQSDVDGFFQRLAREGVAEIRPDAAARPVPAKSRSTLS